MDNMDEIFEEIVFEYRLYDYKTSVEHLKKRYKNENLI